MTAPATLRTSLFGFGPRLQALRLERGYTLDALAAASGLDKGHLSRIERGHRSPSIAAALRLAASLGVSSGELFGEQVGGSISIVRKKTRTRVSHATDGSLCFEPLTSSGTALDAFVVYPTPDFSLPHDAAVHPGEEMVFVLTGAIEVRFADRSVILRDGDFAQFPGHLPHQLRRLGTASASALVAVAAHASRRAKPAP